MPNYEDDIDGGWDRYVEGRMAQADSKISIEPGVHEFVASGAGYDETQCNDAIKDGDVLVVPSEKVVGILYDIAYPVALTKEHGAFGSFIDGAFPSGAFDRYGEQIAKAVEIAKREGFELIEALK